MHIIKWRAAPVCWIPCVYHSLKEVMPLWISYNMTSRMCGWWPAAEREHFPKGIRSIRTSYNLSLWVHEKFSETHCLEQWEFSTVASILLQRVQPAPPPSRLSRGIPIDLAMKLNTITDERELFEEFIENGHDLLLSSFATNTARANRRSSDVEGFSTGACTLLIRIKFVNLSASCCSFSFSLFLSNLRRYYSCTFYVTNCAIILIWRTHSKRKRIVRIGCWHLFFSERYSIAYTLRIQMSWSENWHSFFHIWELIVTALIL